MSIANTKSLVYQLNKTIDKMFWQGITQYPAEYPKVAKIENGWEGGVFTEGEISGLGPMRTKLEGRGIEYDFAVERSPVSRTPTVYSLGFQYTFEQVRDERFGVIKKMPVELSKSAAMKPDTVFWDLFNSGFATHTALDGNYIFVASGRNTLKTLEAMNNRPSSDVALTETSLQAALSYFRKAKDSAGRPIVLTPYLVIVPEELRRTAKVLLGTEKKPGSMDNDINSLNDEGLTYMVSRFLTSTTAWFVLAKEHDFTLRWEFNTQLESADDFETGNSKHKATERFGCYCNHTEGCYGTTGA